MEGQHKPSVNLSQLEAKLQEVQERLQTEERYRRPAIIALNV